MSQRNMLGSAASIEEARGTIADLLEKLGGREGRMWLKKQKLFLRDKPIILPLSEAEPIHDWEVWQRVMVGGLPWARGLLWKLKRANCMVEKSARRMLLSQSFSAHQYGDTSIQEISLVRATRDDLGIKVPEGKAHIGTPIAEVVSAALKRGLYLCPSDAVPQLRIQFMHQPRNTSFLVMTRPLPLRDWRYGLFELQHSWNEKKPPTLATRIVFCPYTDLIGGRDEAELVFWLPTKEAKKPERGGGYAL